MLPGFYEWKVGMSRCVISAVGVAGRQRGISVEKLTRDYERKLQVLDRWPH